MNWSENIEYSASAHHHPTSLDELAEIVANATKIKPLGTRHSFNRVADTNGVHISTSSLDLEASIDTESMTVTVPGSWTYARVAAMLQAEGLALPNMGSLPHISLAGGTATGTHGSGDTNKILAATISGLELVTAGGSVVTIDASTDALRAMAVGLGAFGIVTRLTLDVQPSFLVRQDLYKDPSWESVLAHLDEIMASAYSVNLHADFSTPNVRTIWQKSVVHTTEIEPAPSELWGAKRLDTTNIAPGRVTEFLPPGPWNERLPHFTPSSNPSKGGDELQSEYFVDRNRAVEALNALRSMGSQIDPILYGAEIRTVAADDIWLSPTIGRDCLSIGFTWKKLEREVSLLLPQIEAALEPFEPTPHWGKLFAFKNADLAAKFLKLDDFFALASSLDPTGKFRNPFLNGVAGI